MKSHNHLKMRTVFAIMTLVLTLFGSVGPILSDVYAQDIPIPDTEIEPPVTPWIEYVYEDMYVVHETSPDGTELNAYHVNGPSKPSTELAMKRASSTTPEPGSAVWFSNFPAFSWVFGCGAVAGAMIAAHYDRNGYPNVYTGPTNGGVMPNTDTSWGTWSDGFVTYPSNPLIASQINVDGRIERGSIEDYWVKMDSSADDPYITNVWTQHSWGTAIGDYMKTSQSAYGNADGSSVMWTYSTNPSKLHCNDLTSDGKNTDLTYGMKDFYEARGYSVNTCYNQRTDNQVSGGFSFNDFKSEIDTGHPVLLFIENHFMVGYGYDESSSDILVRDTWDSNANDHSRRMTWGGKYDDRNLLAVGIIHLDQPPVTNQLLTVDKSGTGTGLVTSNPTGINCGSSCSASFSQGTTIVLTATPDAGSTFSGWTGCDSASGYQCQVDMNQARSITATFTLSTPTNYLLTVLLSGFGSGTVTSSPGGIDCGSNCSASFTSGTTVTLTASPSMGSSFFGWSGACSSTSPTCVVSMTEDINVTATFDSPVQQNFTDVPPDHWASDWIYRLFNAGITSGCGTNPLRYCPEQVVNRAQMAIFLLKGRYGSYYTPPPVGSSTGFNDVPNNHWAAPWIKQLAAEGITAGCGGGNYCPDAPVTRAQMAIFLLRAKYGSSFTPQEPSAPFNMIEDPSFETYSPNLFWTEYSSNFGTPLCIPGNCSDSLGSIGPHTGNAWVWFGGTNSYEYAYVEQSLFIPIVASNLEFYLWIGRAASMSGSDDYMKVEIDGVQVFRTD
ncbi:MAG: InlB B-repeat-containing protein, partial [Anaerolineales bacterium]